MAGVAMRSLSPLTEEGTYSQNYELVTTANATIVLRDPAGRMRTMTDMVSAYGALNFGHLNPAIDPFSGLKADLAACFYPKAASQFSEWLLTRLRLPHHRLLYQVGGSFAVSTALAMAQRIRPGRIVVIDGSFHGLGVDTLAASVRGRGEAIQESPLLAGVETLVSRLSVGAHAPDWSCVSCLLYEPVQGANGYVPLPLDWLRDLERGAHAAGVISIADEIQCGYYRHGALSLASRHGLLPDIFLFSKSMTNGLYPMSAVLYPEAFHASLPEHEIYWAHTFQTSAIGCEAALAVARYLDSVDIPGLIDGVNDALVAASYRLSQIEGIGDIHVTGPTMSLGVTKGRARDLVMECEKRSVLIFTGGGGKRVRIAPPITIPLEQLRQALDQIVDAAVCILRPHGIPSYEMKRSEVMTLIEFFESLKTYLEGKRPRLDSSLLSPEANLWELGYIDSLNTVELILFVEGLIDRQITIDSSGVRAFSSIQSIYETFVQQPSTAETVGARPA